MQEEIDAAYEAKHSAKEGNQGTKRPAPRKPAAPKAKKVEPLDDDDIEAVSAPVAPAPSKPVATSKLFNVLRFWIFTAYSILLFAVL